MAASELLLITASHSSVGSLGELWGTVVRLLQEDVPQLRSICRVVEKSCDGSFVSLKTLQTVSGVDQSQQSGSVPDRTRKHLDSALRIHSLIL